MSRVYVGRLPSRCSERDIEKFFKGYGRIRDIVLKNGYGFVEFDNYKDADDAVYDLHGRELYGERVLVEHARLPSGSRVSSRRPVRESARRYGPPTRTEYRVIVENLSSRVSWQDLKDMMRKAGEVTYADAHKSARNEGIVEFTSLSDMRAAIDKFDGYTLYERRLKVYEDRPRQRSISHSRGRSRSYSRRSRSRDSHRRQRSRSESRRKYRSVSRDVSPTSDISRRSVSRSPRRSDRSISRHGGRDSAVSRSPSKNGYVSPERDIDARSASRSRSRSHYLTRSKSRSNSRSPTRSRSNSRLPSREKKSYDEDVTYRRSLSPNAGHE